MHGTEPKSADSLDINDHDYVTANERRQTADATLIGLQGGSYQKDVEIKNMQFCMRELAQQVGSVTTKANPVDESLSVKVNPIERGRKSPGQIVVVHTQDRAPLAPHQPNWNHQTRRTQWKVS